MRVLLRESPLPAAPGPTTSAPGGGITAELASTLRSRAVADGVHIDYSAFKPRSTKF